MTGDLAAIKLSDLSKWLRAFPVEDLVGKLNELEERRVAINREIRGLRDLEEHHQRFSQLFVGRVR